MAEEKGFFMRMRNGLKTIAAVSAAIAISITGCDSPAGNRGTETGGGNQTPIAGHYAIGNLAQTAGSVTAVTITPNPGASPGAVVNIRYDGNAAVPQTAGTFAVTFDVEAAEGWYAATGLSVGDLVVATNAGINWAAVEDTTFGTSNIWGIAWGNNKFVAVGVNGRMAHSSDGISWIAVENSTFTSIVSPIAWGNGRFVTGGASGRMAHSTDGINWTAVEDNSFQGNIYGIAWGGGRFVVGGTGGRMAHSTDGIGWAAVEDSTFEANMSRIAWATDKFVAVGQNGRMAHSTDGISWTAVNYSTFVGNIHSIAWAATGLLLVVRMAGWLTLRTALTG